LLIEIPYSYATEDTKKELFIEYCGSCKGIWLDNKELTSVLIILKKFETIQKDHQSMIRINFEITTKLRVREIFNKFNQAQTNPFEIFIMSFSRMIELIDVENNSLFTMLNLYVLKNVKILPFTLKDSNEVIENVCSFQDAEKLLSKEAVCFYCFSEEEGRIKRTKNEVLKEKNEIIVYGYDYLIDQTLHQQVMKPLLFQ
jgi:Zn-finger nucleic acid-binding protein